MSKHSNIPRKQAFASAHLYFESIHPFEDGNGRIGRALAEKALARTLGRSTLLPLSAEICRERKGYYAALNRASQSLDITEWIGWFAQIAVQAHGIHVTGWRCLIWKAYWRPESTDAICGRGQRRIVTFQRSAYVPVGLNSILSFGKALRSDSAADTACWASH